MSNRATNEESLAQSLVGATITKVRWFDANPDDDWTEHETAWLWLDDGRVIEFGGWGYDAWGATIRSVATKELERER